MLNDNDLKFEKYYKKQAVEFFKENNLGIQTEYEFSDPEKYGYIVAPIFSLKI